jgi:ABC-type polysaccharide/polyol phosphate export permease
VSIGNPFGLFQTILRHRALLRQMIIRDLSARFVGTSLGGLWSLIQPLILLGLYTFVFGVIYRIRFEVAEGVGFVPFLFCGMWPWMAFQEACQRSVTVIVDNAQLMKRVQFPSELLVIAAILSTFLSHGVGFCLMLLGVVIWQGGIAPLSVGLLLIPFGLQLLLAISLGLLLSPANVFLRDVSQLTGALFTVWFFLSPILYSVQMVPESLQPILACNPFTYILHLYRALILAPESLVWSWVLYPLGLSLVLLGLAQRVFSGCKGYFADYL